MQQALPRRESTVFLLSSHPRSERFARKGCTSIEASRTKWVPVAGSESRRLSWRPVGLSQAAIIAMSASARGTAVQPVISDERHSSRTTPKTRPPKNIRSRTKR